MYEYTDKALATLNRQLLRIFRRLRLLDFDELNVVNEVGTAYRQADSLAKKTYLDVGIHAYLFALAEAARAGFDVEIPDADATPIDADWIQDMLFEADPVTLYEYAPEWDRKRQRLIEALAVASKQNLEIDKALRYIVLQVSHYADKSTREAAIRAFIDAGVEKVMWITERDDKVCSKCGPLDEEIFEIDKIPPLQHYRCRCAAKPVE